jgi:hypothetical protein
MFMRRHSSFIILLLSLLVVSYSCSVVKTDITAEELQQHIKYLASDSLKGRLTGSPGDSLAAGYIKARFEEYGLMPLSGDGLQRFKVTEKLAAGKGNALSVNGLNFIPGEDFEPVSITANGSLKAEVVFAGYGFKISNDSVKWNDYQDVDISNRWVMILRSDPEPDNPNSRYAMFSSDRNKAMAAKDMGAAGVLLVSGQGFDASDAFDPLDKGAFPVGIPVIRIKRAAADAILARSKQNISGLEKKINTYKKPVSYPTGTSVEATAEIINHLTNTRNVTMILPGEDEMLKNEYVVLGAHFDHLGMGGPGSSSRATDTIAVHYGADDNASGIAMLIELAGKFAGTKNSHKRSLVFVAFSGEEMGLFGSKYYTDNPVIALDKINLMVNFDMVGRLKESGELTISGVGTADSLKQKLMPVIDTTKIKPVYSEEGSGASDHSAFYSKNIPVLFFYSGGHDDYHKPSDTWDKINYQGMVKIGNTAFRAVSMFANDPARLKFREAGPREDPDRPSRRRGVTIGIMPDVTGVVKNGLRIEAVTTGKPASAGGMKKGDIITSIEGKNVGNIGDYMYRMSQVKKGQRITVEVLRDGKKEVLIIQL